MGGNTRGEEEEEEEEEEQEFLTIIHRCLPLLLSRYL
jgi:hypothetical protein